MILFQRFPLLHLDVLINSKNISFNHFIKEDNYNSFSLLEKRVIYNELVLLQLDFPELIKKLKYFNEHEIGKVGVEDRLCLEILDNFNNEWNTFRTLVWQRFNLNNRSRKSRLVSVIKELMVRSCRNTFDVKAISMFLKGLLGDGSIIDLVKMKHQEFNTIIYNKNMILILC